jgi:hypothetical protein
VLAPFPSSLELVSAGKKFPARILFNVGQILGHCKKKDAAGAFRTAREPLGEARGQLRLTFFCRGRQLFACVPPPSR